MKIFHRIAIICTSLVMASCALMQPRYQEIQIPPARIIQMGYSYLPFNEKGWFVRARTEFELALRKSAENPDESTAIHTTLSKIEPYKSKEEFVLLVKESQAEDTDPQRFKLIQNNVEYSADKEKITDCVKSHWVAEDNAAVRLSGNKGVMLLETLALICSHPKNRRVIVYAGYSQRYYAGHRDDAFVEKADTIFNSLEFR